MNTIKDKIGLLTLLSFLVFAAPSQGTVLSFTPDDAVFVGPTELVVDVVVDDISDLLGFSLIVGYDPTVLDPVSVEAGGLMLDGTCNIFFDWLNSGSGDGTIQVDSALFGCTASGGGTVISITFAGVSTGLSPVQILEADFRDSQNQLLPVEVLTGQIQYLTEILASLSFTPEGAVFDSEGFTEICLTMSQVEDFLGASLAFGFDPGVIVPVIVSPGQALEDAGCTYFIDWVNSDGFTNTVIVDLALFGCTASMDGPVVCIQFQGVGLGESPLVWQDPVLRDSLNAPIQVNLINGTVIFDPAVDSTASTLGMLKAIYR